MKRFFTILLIFNFVYGVSAQIVMVGSGPMETKKETIDTATIRISYDFKCVRDSLKPDRTTSDLLILEISKNKVSKFYSDNLRVRDSIVDQAKKQAGGGNLNLNFERKFPSGFSAEQSVVFKNYPKNKLTVTDAIMSTSYSYEENLNELMKWQILPDTMTLLGYSCQKAVTLFRGRQFEVWFTPDIPISEGPWKFCGLPGLILQASDSRKHYVYQCNGITQVNTPIELVKKDYLKASRKDFDKIKRKVTENPMEYLKSSMPNANIKIVARDESGNTVENPKFSYNPIELE